MGDADDLKPFFLAAEPHVDLLQPVRVLRRADGFDKIDAVPAQIEDGLIIVPFVVPPRLSCRPQFCLASNRVEFFSQLYKTYEKGVHISHSDQHAPCPATPIFVPDAKRPDIACRAGEKIHIAVRDRVPYQSNKIAKGFGLAIPRTFFCDVGPPNRHGLCERFCLTGRLDVPLKDARARQERN